MDELSTEEWLGRLVASCASGLYQRDQELGSVGNLTLGDGSPFPWQNKTCKDCPFWRNSLCHVHGTHRFADADTCEYLTDQVGGSKRMRARQWQGFQRWHDWFQLGGW